MTIHLYNNNSDSRMLNKDVTTLASNIEATPLLPLDVVNPTFTLDYEVSYLQYLNYIYCVETQRFYYVTKKVLEAGNRITIDCEVDVLQSYEQEIRNLYCTVIRSEVPKKKTYLVDPEYIFDGRRDYDYFYLPSNVFNIRERDNTSYNFVMALAGGADS